MTLMQDEAFVAFLEEAREHLVTLEEGLLRLEKQRGNPSSETINAIFRAAHTIKGSSGFFALDKLKALSHAAENVLGLIRARAVQCTPAVISALLQASDLLRLMLDDVEHQDQVDAAAVIEQLALIEVEGPPDLDAAQAPPAPAESAATPPPVEAPAAEAPAAPRTAPSDPALPSSAAFKFRSMPTQLLPGEEASQPTSNSIRVNLAQLDRLMMLAGELVLTRNALLKKANERDLDEMINLSQRVDAITSQLQDGIMATRMQPVGLVFNRFRRVVRDLSLRLGKPLQLTIEGEEVELDKTLIEALVDPLTHIVRNAADHGIETPARRAEDGKGEIGRLHLRAFHEAGQVVIEASDDGAGIDPAKVAKKALERGMFTQAQLDAMSDADKVRLVFAAGLSTTEQVTELSGRGVGMDVVMSSIVKVGGTVDITSTLKRGTTVMVRLPLTLAIIPSLLVSVNGERFAIPQVNLSELVRISPKDVQRRVERIGSALVLRQRGELLPLVRLSELLGIQRQYRDAHGELQVDRRDHATDRRSDQGEGHDDERRSGDERRVAPASTVYVAVLSSGPTRYGLVVDQFLDSEEIVIKPLSGLLAACTEYAGSTILGDGTVALILDVAGVAQVANVAATRVVAADAAVRRQQSAAALSHDAQTWLVTENAEGERFGVPLGLVSRIEKVRADAIHMVGGRKTLTLGGSILGVAAIDEVAHVQPRPDTQHVFVIICKVAGREVGLLFSHIADVVDGTSAIDPATHVQRGLLGSTLVDGQLLLLIDVHGLVAAQFPEYRATAPAVAAADDEKLVLVVEDSPFFRKQMVSCLEDVGFKTLSAEDGQQGLAALETHAGRVGLVFTDIEMPAMDGLEMTRRIRADRRFGALPVLAVTSLSGTSAERDGALAGLTEYLVKLDREQIVERASHHLRRPQPPFVHTQGAP